MALKSDKDLAYLIGHGLVQSVGGDLDESGFCDFLRDSLSDFGFQSEGKFIEKVAKEVSSEY